jgi:hypothetical protein
LAVILSDLSSATGVEGPAFWNSGTERQLKSLEMFNFVRPGPCEMVKDPFTKTLKWSLKVSRIVEWWPWKLPKTGVNGQRLLNISREMVASNFTENGFARA